MSRVSRTKGIERARMLLVAVAVLAFSAGCANVVTSKLDPQSAARTLLSEGTAFTASTNPFMYTAGMGNASDPSAIWAPTAGGNKLLVVTSEDMKTTVPQGTNYYPMENTNLWVLDPIATQNNRWVKFPKVAEEKNMSWANTSAKHLWAPEIDFRTLNNTTTYYLFVPALKAGTANQQIGVFSRSGDPYGSFGTSSDYVHIKFAQGGEEDFAYDPGVFHFGTGANISDYWLVYCNGEVSSNGRIYIAQFQTNDFKQAKGYGELKFNGLPGLPNNSFANFYMEGPDLFVVPQSAGVPEDMVYLQFAAKFNQNEQEYIGYAYRTKASFLSDVSGAWTFGGWIQKQIDPSNGSNPSPETAEWTNHGSIAPVTLPDGRVKYYYFYQYSFGDNAPADGQMRQTAMFEIHFQADGKIQGVSASAGGSLFNDPYPVDGTLNSALTRDGVKGENLPVEMEQPFIYINNPENHQWDSWLFLYWVRGTGSGEPIVEGGTWPGFTERIRQFGQRVYAIELTATGPLLANGSYPSAGDPIHFAVHNIQHNSYSQPALRSFFSNANNIPVIGRGTVLFGKNPKLRITSAWASNSGRTMTASSQLVGNEHMVMAMPWQITWGTQDWEIETIPGSINIRIKDTDWGDNLYVKAPGTVEGGRVSLATLDTGASNLKWQIEPESGTNWVRIKNYGSGKYLTRGDPSTFPSNDRDDYVSIYQQKLNPDWESQRWIVTYK